MSEIETIKIQLLPGATLLPKRAHSTDAGIDIFAQSDVYIPATALARISTGNYTYYLF